MRRSALCLALLLTALAPASSSPAWTQFRLRSDNNAALTGSLTASWHVVTDGAFSSSPSFVDGTVYAGNNAGSMFAFAAASGKVLWRDKVTNPLMSSPIIYGNLVIMGEGNENSPEQATPSRPLRVGDPPNALFALNRASGVAVWRVALPGSGMPTPAILAGTLVQHNGYGSVIAFEPLTGRRLYERNLHSIASMSAVLPINAQTFVTAGVGDTAVWALRIKDGATVWRTPFSAVASGLGDCPPAADDARVYCDYATPPTSAVPAQTERQAHFRAFAIDARTGKKLWDVALDAGVLPKRNEAAVPLIARDTLYLGSSVAPIMHALDARTGRIKWRTKIHGPVKGGIVDVAGTLYFGDLAGYLWALSADTGRVIGMKNMHASFNVGSPIVAGQTLFIGSRGGTFWAIPLAQIRSARDT